jgi:hypothetical protein
VRCLLLGIVVCLKCNQTIWSEAFHYIVFFVNIKMCMSLLQSWINI